ncbi:helix-turn-helix domain-containing protein [Virgibacillus sp. Bac330]|uniref:helix-turn-helix domain-containing protein n=1 Tax=Virgibacillus sp. Bac330 TaxID=2419841 RepID=UPI000EF5107F|nr:helix-turn-helix transcriptional regulator [Virgibacillus sp. Bac330]
MIDIGYIIKLHRTKQNMTQEALSEGIVSLSYLSKIENQKAKANSEIIQALCNRLGIELTNIPDSNFEDKCKKWYDMLYDRFDKQEIITRYEELQNVMDKSINNQTIMFEIHKVRYYIILRDFQKALHKINELHEMADSFNSLHKYFWNKFQGNYYSLKEEHQQSLQCYKKAEKVHRSAEIEEEEIADLYYAISIQHSHLLNGLETINYAEKAMAEFQRKYNFTRCAQCHILLGISYQRIRMNDVALENYNQAMYLGKLNNEEQVIQLAYLNLGLFYFTTGNSKKSIENYELGLKTTDLDYELRLDAITHLIHSFYKSDNWQKTKVYLRSGEEALNFTQDKGYHKFYSYVIKTYTHLLNGDLKNFKIVLADEFIPYLKQKKAYNYLVFYSRLLATHLEKMGKYKEAMKYYKVANESYDKIIKL